MLTIDLDYKYPTSPPRFYTDTASCVMSMANPKSGGVKNDWIMEVYYV